MENTQKFFKLLFQTSDKVCSGDFKAVKVKNQPTKPAEFFSINPLHGYTNFYKAGDGSIAQEAGGRRSDLNVTRFHNFLFEMDGRPLPEQLELLNKIALNGVNWAAITFSGGKSYHAIISLEEPLEAKPHTVEGVQRYKAVWEALALELSRKAGFQDIIFDEACKNPSRLSRCPGFTAEGRKLQELVSLGRLTTNSQLASLLQNAILARPISALASRGKDANSEQEARLMLPSELAAKLKLPKTWIKGAEGNYGDVFKLALWTLDSTGCDAQTLVSLFEKNTFPALRSVGYPEYKLMKPLEDALRLKGKL